MKCPFCIKYCKTCNRLLVAYIGNFNKHPNGKYKLNNQCKECRSNYRKKYNQEHKEQRLKYNKQYYKDNPHAKFNDCGKRRAREDEQGNGITKDQWFEMMNFFDWRCAYSGEYLGGDGEHRTIDHIEPLSKGGEHEVWNCVPAYDSYNYSKHTDSLLDWYIKQPYYSDNRLDKIYQWVEYAKTKWMED
jgi:hypothetical protein